MEKVYRVRITSIDPATKEEEELLDDEYAGLTLCADCGDGRMAEVIMHDTIMELAMRLAQGKKTRDAVRLANVLMAIHDEKNNAEDALLRAIMGDE